MTLKECAIIQAYTGYVLLRGDNFAIFHKYIEKVIGRPVATHEIPGLFDIIHEKSRSDFIELCRKAEDRATKNKSQRKSKRGKK